MLSSLQWHISFPDDIPIPSSSFSTDACLAGGAGFYDGDWFFVDWVRDLSDYKDMNIDVL
jgi:hypothetical protein